MAEIGRLFDGIAPRYDLLNHVFSLGLDLEWRRRVVSSLPSGNPGRILDCCTGTADQAIALALRFPGAVVSGIDLSPGMVAIGRRKTAMKGLSERVCLSVADVHAPPFDESSFDMAAMSFGLRNLEERGRALRAIRSVLKPRGVLRILEFAPVPARSIRTLYRWYRRRVMPVVGGLLSGSTGAYRYLSSSIEGFMDEGEVKELLGDSGFTCVRSRALSFGIVRLFSAQRPG